MAPDRGGRHPAGCRLDVGQVAGEGQDRTVVLGIGVDVEEAVGQPAAATVAMTSGHDPR